MDNRKLAIVGGIMILTLAGLAWLTQAVGHGEWFTVAMAAGLGAAIIYTIEVAVPHLLPDDMAGQTRMIARQVVGSLVLILIVVSRMYPSELTLDLLANRVSAAELSGNRDAYLGEKVRVRGVLFEREHVYGLEVVDDSGTLVVEPEGDFDVPPVGSEVVVIGTVREYGMGQTEFHVARYAVVTPADEMVAAAE